MRIQKGRISTELRNTVIALDQPRPGYKSIISFMPGYEPDTGC